MILMFDNFKFATYNYYTLLSITTADWDSLYNLYYAPLDASICSVAMISLYKH